MRKSIFPKRLGGSPELADDPYKDYPEANGAGSPYKGQISEENPYKGFPEQIPEDPGPSDMSTRPVTRVKPRTDPGTSPITVVEGLEFMEREIP